MNDRVPTAPYPLVWPESLPRSKNRGDAQFRTTLSAALDNVMKSLAAFGKDTGVPVSRINVTSNVAGLLNRAPSDPGVAVWFLWDGAGRCFAVDRYVKVEWNLQAIHHIIEAERTKLRHGGMNIVRQSFRSFAAALPAPGDKPWWQVIGCKPDASDDEMQAAYRARARELHARGDEGQMQELNVARDKARART